MTYETFEDAFYFVSSASPGEHAAVVNPKTGEVYFASDMAGHDGMPDDLDYNDDYLEIPHKHELNPAILLVADFIRLHCPEQRREVGVIFTRPAASSRYKAFLAAHGLLETWYCFEIERTREALLQWCRERGLHLEVARK